MSVSQVEYPWRSVVRTVFQVFVAVCAMAPVVFTAATGVSAEAAVGVVGVGLAVAAGVTRVMALPQVEGFLRVWVPWLAAGPAGEAGDVRVEG